MYLIQFLDLDFGPTTPQFKVTGGNYIGGPHNIHTV